MPDRTKMKPFVAYEEQLGEADTTREVGEEETTREIAKEEIVMTNMNRRTESQNTYSALSQSSER